MYTPHIAIQSMTIDDVNIIRIVCVSTMNDFSRETNNLYPGIDTTSIHMFYNVSKWYNRILQDIQYKHFKYVTCTTMVNGILQISTLKSDLIQHQFQIKDWFKNWFDNEFIPFIKMKLLAYSEDEEIDKDIIEDILQYINEHKEYDRYHYDTYVSVDGDFISLNIPEKTIEDTYVLTMSELVGIIFFTIYYFKDDYEKCICHNICNEPIDISEKAHLPHLSMTVCEYTKNIYFNKKTFHKTEILQTLKDILWKLSSGTKSGFSLLLTLISNPGYQNFIGCSVSGVCDYEIRHCGNGIPEWIHDTPCEQFMYYDIACIDSSKTFKMFKNEVGNTYFGPPTPQLSSASSTKEDNSATTIIRGIQELKHCPNKMNTNRNDKLHVSPNMLYKNTISGECKRCIDAIKYHSEFVWITEINVSTDIGRYITDTIPHIKGIQVNTILDDLHKCINIIQNLYPDTCDETKEDATHDMQKKLTKQYVEQYKCDTSETIASMVIDKVFIYLSQFMKPKDINMNRIGTDLVELGIKKTRKTKGYVYTIQNPSRNKIEEFSQKKQDT